MFLDFPVFAVAFGRHKENEAAKAGYLVVAGGGGSAKSGVQNTIVSGLRRMVTCLTAPLRAGGVPIGGQRVQREAAGQILPGHGS